MAVARALALNPSLIVCDEPVSALDVSIQAQVLNLLDELKEDFGFSYLFISHDIGVVEHVADRIAVMTLGKSSNWPRTLICVRNPKHPYTQALMAAIPLPRQASGKTDRICWPAMSQTLCICLPAAISIRAAPLPSRNAKKKCLIYDPCRMIGMSHVTCTINVPNLQLHYLEEGMPLLEGLRLRDTDYL